MVTKFINRGARRRVTVRVYDESDAAVVRAVANYLTARRLDPTLPEYAPPPNVHLRPVVAAHGVAQEARAAGGPAEASPPALAAQPAAAAAPAARPRPAILDMTREAELGAGHRQSDKGSTNR